MFGLGLPEILIIVLAIGILFFGGKKITEFARSLGRFSGEFKKGKKEIETELADDKNSDTPSHQ
ncbi:twin-arginine translocase TatA/TatE family subunit [Candidatus Kaiserbacteria bacterium]|nr:twin-arginine translocase TatA/TatE family subunit [Candidatus Kaiserbacteria bacterium]